MFDPSFTDGALKPVGRKLLYGFTIAYAGIAEIPIQAIKGSKEGDTLGGFCKGVWFF